MRFLPQAFSNRKVPVAIPRGMQDVVDVLKESKTKMECLRRAYDILSERYHGHRFKTYTHLSELFSSDLLLLWNRRGFLHCTNLNYLLKILLVKSELFKDEDIYFRWTAIWFISPHQYVTVKINEADKVNVDLWGKIYGIPFGEYAHGARSGSFRERT